PLSSIALGHAERLFPNTPFLVAWSEERHLKMMPLGAHDTVVPVAIDLAALIGNILEVLPDTANIMIVLGNSPLERFWRAEFESEAKRFRDRALFTWCDDLSLDQICRKASALPAHSAILYALMMVDAAGVPHEQDTALAILYGSAHAPLFAVFERQLGLGIVGGPLLSVDETGRQAAQAARAILGGENAGSIRRKPIELSHPVFDWR